MFIDPSAVIPFPHIDPVAIPIPALHLGDWTFGPFDIRWYSLAYIAGIFYGWWHVLQLLKRPKPPFSPQHAEDFLVWVTLGIILGGRIGYVLFYNFDYYAEHPLEVLQVWSGGMSFHGGLIGVILAELLFCARYRLDLVRFADYVACCVPVGLLLGRLANFINGELWGRATDVPWAMIFPDDTSQLPRHPSQLYEGFLEGIVLFAVLNFLFFKTDARLKRGFLSGVFLVGYALIRFGLEFVRQPDAQFTTDTNQLGTVFSIFSMGQMLTIPMLLGGLYMIWRAKKVS